MSFNDATRPTVALADIDLKQLVDEQARAAVMSALERQWDVRREAIPAMEDFCREVTKSSSERPTAVFLAAHHGNFPSVEYLAYLLRERHGARAYGVYLSNTPPDGLYDEVFCCSGSLWVLANVLGWLPPVPVYVQAQARWVFLGVLARALRTQSVVVHEFYDWMTFFIPDQSEQEFERNGVFSQTDVRMMKACERCACDAMDGIVYKSGGDPMRSMVAKMRAPAVRMLPSPPRSWMREPTMALRGTRPRLVYAGQVKNRDLNPTIFGDMYYIPVIREFTNQGLPVDVYGSYARSDEDFRAQFSDYLDEETRNPLFTMHRGVPVRQLVQRLAATYDYGLIAYSFPDELVVGREHLESAMASKLFTYIAAGLPVVVSDELKYMAEWVEEHGVGVVLQRNDLPRLGNILAKMDYAELCIGVKRVQESAPLEASAMQIREMLFGRKDGKTYG